MNPSGELPARAAPSGELAGAAAKGLANPASEYWEKRLAACGGLEGVGFVGFGLAYNEWMYRVRKRVVLRELSRFGEFVPSARVLDIGSGTGFWIEVWRTLGVKAPAATEMTEVATEHLRQKFHDCRVIRSEITSPNAAAAIDAKFDFISALDVLFHITTEEGFETALGNIERLLKSGGHFVFSENVPHRAHPPSPTQVNRTLTRYCGELDRRGLRIVRRVPLFALMNAPVDVDSALVRRLWRVFMMP